MRGSGATVPEWKAPHFAQMVWVYEEITDLLVQMRDQGLPLDPAALEEGDAGFWSDLGLPVPALWPGWGTVEEAVFHYSEAARARVLWDLLGGTSAPAVAGEVVKFSFFSRLPTSS